MMEMEIHDLEKCVFIESFPLRTSLATFFTPTTPRTAGEHGCELLEGDEIPRLFVFVDGDRALFRVTLYLTPFGGGLGHGVNSGDFTPEV